MAKSLIIVESPAKARTITKYLGRGYTVMASVGHVKDLPTSKLGVDLEHDFKPQYVIIKGKAKVLAEIKNDPDLHQIPVVVLTTSKPYSFPACCNSGKSP